METIDHKLLPVETEMLNRTLAFLQANKIFYVATIDDDKPRVRPFGLVVEHEGKLYFSTGNSKPVYRQLQANPQTEICATSPAMEWIRLAGKAVFDSNLDVKRKAFEQMPMLAGIYETPENPSFEVFYLADAEVTFQAFGGNPETGRL